MATPILPLMPLGENLLRQTGERFFSRMESIRMMESRVRTIARPLREGIRSVAKVLLQAQRDMLRIRAIRAEAKTVRPLNVILGAGPITMQGWVATDAAVLDVTSGRAWKRLFTPNSIDRLMAEHLFEHLSEPECAAAFKECFRYLKPRGLLRVAVPDGNRKDPEYMEEVSPPKDGHQLLFTVDDLTRQLARVGFRVTPLEYFDAKEEFHCYPWEEDDGLIRRSARFDRRERFKRGTLYYTSLIVDARKP